MNSLTSKIELLHSLNKASEALRILVYAPNQSTAEYLKREKMLEWVDGLLTSAWSLEIREPQD